MVDKKLVKGILKKNPQIDPESFQELVDLFTDQNGNPILKRKGYELDMNRRAKFVDISDRPVELSRNRSNRPLHNS